MTAKKQSEQGGKAGTEMNFEKALERLETIVAEMEEGKMGLEDMIVRFEEGQKLIGFCTQKLNEVERKIEILVKKGKETAAEPFDVQGEGEEEGDDDKGGLDKGKQAPF